MGKSINMSLEEDDKALLVRCSDILHQANQGNPLPILDVMRESRTVILAYHPQKELVRLMGEVATYVRSQVVTPSMREKQVLVHQQCIAAIGKGLTHINERQAMFIKDAAELYVRMWLGQYSHLNFTLGMSPFNSLSNNDIWETISSARLDGMGIRNPNVPETVRQAYSLSEKLSDMCKSFRREREESGKEFE